jgi:outer membrane protein assembly factor BamA
MKLVPLFVFLAAATWVWADVPESVPEAIGTNINSRYTVESISLAPNADYRLSGSVTAELERLVGARLNVDALSRLSRRITQELKARSVTFRVSRGEQAAHVRVTFEVERQETNFDVSLSKLMYDSQLGWSGSAQVAATFGDNVLTFAGLSNADDSVDRYSGIRARFDRLHLYDGRLRLGVEFDAFEDHFDNTTLAALNSKNNFSLGAGAFRSRLDVEPSATFVLAAPLTLSVGMSFESLQGNVLTGTNESADAFTSALRFHDQWRDADDNIQDVDAAYTLRAATRMLGASAAYTKHAAHVRYTYRHERQLVEVALKAGVIYGQAPLFERFVLGNTSTLRGWSKDDLDPLGGNRTAAASVTYGYRIMRVFYDTGSVWDRGKSTGDKQSVGAGVTSGFGMFGKDALLLALAFPIREGHVVPVFIAGMSF